MVITLVPQKLRIMILKHLAVSPQSGYGLTKSIAEATGWKPSYGSMYPQLESLKEEGLVTVKEDGRKKVYSLTKKGEEASSVENREELLENMRENMNALAHMLDFNAEAHDQVMSIFFSAMKDGKNPFAGTENSSVRIKLAFLKLYEEGKLKKHLKKVNSIMNEAAEKMEKL